MFYDLKKIEAMQPLFQCLENCRGVEQNPEHHPEGDVFSHSIQVLNLALRESDDLDLFFAAMLHDIGKQVHTLGHEKYSCDMLAGKISEKTEWLISQHIRIKWFLSGEMKDKKKIHYLYNHQWFPELILLTRWDTMGRRPSHKPEYSRVDIIHKITQFSEKQRTL